MVVIQPYILVSKLKKIKTKFLRCTGYLNSIKNTIKQDLLLILVLVPQQTFLNRLWCLTVSLSLSHWYPGSGVVLDCIDS